VEGDKIIYGLIQYVTLVIMLTFHEFGHAWMAHKCGDDTAKHQGRVSLNPLAHIDPVGTVLLPMLMIFLSMSESGSKVAGFLIGWAKPVPVNLNNLRNPKLDDVLITMAGPWMNLLLAVASLGIAKIGIVAGVGGLVEFGMLSAILNLALFFFNLIPIPPLDGSRILRVVVGMSHETYHQFAQYGFLLIILAINFTPVRRVLGALIFGTFSIIGGWFGIG
jgi:Zn-dependent protease